MSEEGSRSIHVISSRTEKLYKDFKKKAAEHFVPVKVALREAMMLWLKKEMGDQEFSRYMALFESYREIRERVKELLSADDIEDLENKIRAILNEY